MLSAKNPVQRWMNIQKCNRPGWNVKDHIIVHWAAPLLFCSWVGRVAHLFDHPRVGFFGGVILHTLDLPPTQDAIVANKVKGLAWNPYSKRNNPGGDWLGGRCNAYRTCSLLNIQERISIFNLYPWQMTTWFHVSCSHPWPGHSDECLAQSTTTRAVRTQQVWRPSL